MFSLAKYLSKSPSQTTSATHPKHHSNDRKRIAEYVVILSGRMFRKTYYLNQLIGEGSFAKCYAVQRRGSKRILAAKMIEKKILQVSEVKIRVPSFIM